MNARLCASFLSESCSGAFMLKGVEVVCFLACYALALILELARLRFQNRRLLAAASFSVIAIGAVAHVAFLYHHNLLQNNHFFASASGWLYVLAFLVVLVEIYFTLVYKRAQFGVFLLPLAICLIALGLCAGSSTFPETTTFKFARAFHGIALLFTALVSFLGFATGVMYFWQRRRMKSKNTRPFLPLPSLEWLSKSGRFSANVSAVALGLGVASGYYLKLFDGFPIRSGAQNVDFVALGSTILLIFAIISRVMTERRSARDASRANALHNLICAAALGALLLCAVIPQSGHLRVLSNGPDGSATDAQVEQSDLDSNDLQPPIEPTPNQ